MKPPTNYPLSYGQRAIWLAHQLAPDSAAYNIVRAGRIVTELDISTFRDALQEVVNRHPTLRTTFHSSSGEPVQRVHPFREVNLHIEDASEWSEAYLNARLVEDGYRPFDIERESLMRSFVYSRSPSEHIWLLALHHLVTDLWSMAIMLYEVGVLYTAKRNGAPASLKPLAWHYTDHVHTQIELLQGPEGERLWAYWKSRLAGQLPVLNLPTDKPRLSAPTDRGASHSFRIGKELTAHLKDLGKVHGTNLFMILLAAFQVLLHRYTGQEDILIGSPVAGRYKKVVNLLGYFVNPVVLRADLSGNPTFSEFLDRVRKAVSEDFGHGEYPFHLLAEQLPQLRGSSGSPLIRAVFAWQKTTRLMKSENFSAFIVGGSGEEILELGDISLKPVPMEQRGVPFDLALWMAEGGGELHSTLEYSAGLFEKKTIERMAGHLTALLEGIVQNPDQHLSDLPLLSPAEHRQLIIDWNGTGTVSRPYRSIPELFEMQAAERPDSIALVLETEEMSYGELNFRANQLARYLRRLGIRPNDVVGLWVERSLEAIVAIIGILKAGGVYLPLLPSDPPKRLSFIMKNAGVKVLITQQRLLDGLPISLSEPNAPQPVCLDTHAKEIAGESRRDLSLHIEPESLAYIIYTSGSTGQPKGVLIPHSAISSHILDMQQHYGLIPQDRVLQFASLSFDQSLEQILPTLISGATLVMRGPEIWPAADFSRKLEKHRVSVANLPPAYWHQWIQETERAIEHSAPPQLRLVIIGGDIMLSESLKQWQKTFTNGTRLLNAYGPTETTITALTYEIETSFDRMRIPIGRPIANRVAYILDGAGHPVPIGVTGELHLGAVELAAGYLGQPALTAEKFIPNPFSKDPGARLYRTGDLARYLPDGNIDFLGRMDNQVKIRGFRIELSEIESVLAGHKQVNEAAVVLVEGAERDKHLAACLTGGSNEQSRPSPDELRTYLRERLPDHMVPSAFTWLDALPKTPSGKVDRNALPVPDFIRTGSGRGYIEPRTPIEKDLAVMWAELLRVDKVGIYDNFFELGGHSLIGTQIISRLHGMYHLDLSLRRLFELPTVAELASFIEKTMIEEEEEEQLEKLLAELESLSEEEIRESLTHVSS